MPMILIFGIFYLLLIRPQQKRQREHEALLKAVGRGDRIVTRWTVSTNTAVGVGRSISAARRARTDGSARGPVR